MSFNGYLIKLGGASGTVLPLKYMRYDTYKVTPNQRIDLDSTVDTAGHLHRNVLNHTRTKIEFETPRLTNTQVDQLMSMIRSAWSDKTSRKLTIEYYDPETNGYKVGTFYMPDISFTISNIDVSKNEINYNQTRLAFIEY